MKISLILAVIFTVLTIWAWAATLARRQRVSCAAPGLQLSPGTWDSSQFWRNVGCGKTKSRRAVPSGCQTPIGTGVSCLRGALLEPFSFPAV